MVVVVLIFVLAAVLAGVFAVRRGGKERYTEALRAWKADDLGRFEVNMRDTSLKNVFDTFDDDGGSYMTPESIEQTVAEATKSELPKKFVDGTEQAVLRAMKGRK